MFEFALESWVAWVVTLGGSCDILSGSIDFEIGSRDVLGSSSDYM